MISINLTPCQRMFFCGTNNTFCSVVFWKFSSESDFLRFTGNDVLRKWPTSNGRVFHEQINDDLLFLSRTLFLIICSYRFERMVVSQCYVRSMHCVYDARRTKSGHMDRCVPGEFFTVDCDCFVFKEEWLSTMEKWKYRAAINEMLDCSGCSFISFLRWFLEKLETKVSTIFESVDMMTFLSKCATLSFSAETFRSFVL